MVLGGSHSAFSVLHKLLEGHTAPGLRLRVLHRDPIRRMHLSTEAAIACGEVFDPVQDICPQSGRVFRFQGLYTRSRLLYEQILDGQHPHIELVPCKDIAQLAAAVSGADLVISATGYLPRIPKMVTSDGATIEVGRNGAAAMVNNRGLLCDAQGAELKNIYGIGLGFGRAGSGVGEPSYFGGPVGINIFQGPDGAAICACLDVALEQNRRKVG